MRDNPQHTIEELATLLEGWLETVRPVVGTMPFETQSDVKARLTREKDVKEKTLAALGRVRRSDLCPECGRVRYRGPAVDQNIYGCGCEVKKK